MEGSPLGSRRADEQEFNLREWHLRARISRENTNSRRYSASYIRSFGEHSKSFQSNFTISSTASSPGYLLKDEIDPSTYSFTTALKALQAKAGYVWECLQSPEGFALSSKWDEAERYISNPLSGQVPMECLSAKTLSGRSFRSQMASRVTMSAPLVYSVQPRRTHTNTATATATAKPPPYVDVINELVSNPQFHLQEEKLMGSRTRDVGTQSTPTVEEGSSSPSPTSTPPIRERSIRHCEETEDGDTQNSSSSTKLNLVTVEQVVEVKVTREVGEETKRRTKEGGHKRKKMKKNRTGQFCNCRQSSGCLLLSWESLWMKKRQREKHKFPLSKSKPKQTN